MKQIQKRHELTRCEQWIKDSVRNKIVSICRPVRRKMATIPLTVPSTEPICDSFWWQILAPNNKLIVNWNRFVLVIVILDLFVDSCFFFLPMVKGNMIAMDFKAAGRIIYMRMIGDSINICAVVVRFRTAYESSGNGVFRRRDLVKDPAIIFRKYLYSYFILDLIAALPLPQAYLWYTIPELKSCSPSDYRIYFLLSIIIFIQYLPRFCRLIPLTRNILETTGNVTNHGWTGAISFLLLYVILSQFIGSWYYLNYIFQLSYCKYEVFRVEEGIANATNANWSQLLAKCHLADNIDNGIFSDVHKNGIASATFLQRIMYCFSWGLKSLSSMGQNFETSFISAETMFSFFMTICGLVLFAGLIAQMQTSIQSGETGEDQHIIRLREIEEWIKLHQLPPDLNRRVRQTVSSEWIVSRRLDEKSVLSSLPSELQCDVRRKIYLDLVCNLPFFTKLDTQLVHSFCGYLRTFSGTKGTCLVVEGEPVRELFFIYCGLLEGMVLDGGCCSLREGDLSGTELFAWVLQPSASTHNLPLSTQTVMCLTNIDAFCIRAEDLKLLAVQCNHDSNFQQAVTV